MENGDRETLGHVAVAHDGEEHGAAADVARALIEDSSVAPTPTATSPLAGSTDSGRSGEPNDGSSGSDSDEDATRTAHKKSADGIGAKLKLSSKSRRKRKHNKLEYAPLQEQDAALIDNDLLLPASPMDTRQRDEHDDHDTSSTSSSSATTTATTATTSSLSASSSSSSSSSSRESVQVAEHPLERSGEWKHSTLPVFVKRTGPPLPPPPAPMMMAFSDETPSHLDEYNGDAYDSPIKPPARPDAAVAIDLSVEEQELAEANNLAARQAALQRTRLEHAPLAGDLHLSYLLLPPASDSEASYVRLDCYRATARFDQRRGSVWHVVISLGLCVEHPHYQRAGAGHQSTSRGQYLSVWANAVDLPPAPPRSGDDGDDGDIDDGFLVLLPLQLIGSAEEAAFYFGIIDGSTSIMQLLGSPLVGVLADRYGRACYFSRVDSISAQFLHGAILSSSFGRKPLLSFSLVGLLAYSTLAIAACFTADKFIGRMSLAYVVIVSEAEWRLTGVHDDLVGLLLVGSLVSGATAGERIMYSAIVSDVCVVSKARSVSVRSIDRWIVAHSHLTDSFVGARELHDNVVQLTTPQERPRYFGFLGLALGSGFVIGALVRLSLSLSRYRNR